MKSETILNVFPANDGKSRLVIAVQSPEDNGDSGRDGSLILRQESFSDDVGWFVQSRVALEPEQIPGLKMTLTGGVARQMQSTSATRTPAILRFAGAVAG